MIVITRTALDEQALRNLKVDPADLLDDGRDWDNVVVRKPWGSERQVYRGENCCIWRLELNPGAETSMHCHRSKRAVLTVERGRVVLQTLLQNFVLQPGESASIEAGSFHRSRTGGGAVILETEFPANRRDIVRLYDLYGRVGKGYECA